MMSFYGMFRSRGWKHGQRGGTWVRGEWFVASADKGCEHTLGKANWGTVLGAGLSLSSLAVKRTVFLRYDTPALKED